MAYYGNPFKIPNLTVGSDTGWIYSTSGVISASSPRNEVLTGLSVSTNSTILNTDNFITAFGKLQSQINNFSGGGANTTLSNLTSPTAINEDLLASGTKNIGNNSSGIWENIYAKNLTAYNSSATPLSLERISTSPGKWDFNITSDPVGSGEIFTAGSLTIVGQSANRSFAVRAGNTSLPQFRVHPTRVEIVGSDTSDYGQLYINNTINNNSSSEILMHSNDGEYYQGLTMKFGANQYAWINTTSQTHSNPSFFQIANDMLYTNARVGIRVSSIQKAIFRQESVIFNPISLIETTIHPFLINDVSYIAGEALAVQGINSKDTTISVNQDFTNLAGTIQIKSESNYTWLAQHGSTHVVHPNRSFLSFNNPDGILGLRAGNTSRFALTYSGNIGIGENFYDPSYMFHVKLNNPSAFDTSMFENANGNAYVNTRGGSEYGAYHLFFAGANYADIGITGSSHPTLPNIFAFTINPETKTRFYQNSSYYWHYQYHLESNTYARFGFGQNIESDSILGIKRTVGDIADSFSIKNASDVKQFFINDNFTFLNNFLYIGNNFSHTSNANAHLELQFDTNSGYDPITLYDENESVIFDFLNNGQFIISNSIIPNFFQGWDVELGSINAGERFSNIYTQAININPSSDKPSIKLLSGLSTTSENGAIEYDYTNGFYITHNNIRSLLSGSNINKTLFVQTSTITLNNTQTETTLLGSGIGFLTIAANTFLAGASLRIKLNGTFDGNASTNFTIRIKLNSIEHIAITIPASSNNDGGFCFDSILTCTTNGASGNIQGHGSFNAYNTPNIESQSNSGITIDTTISQTLNITGVWGTSSTTNIIITNAIIELLNA